MAGQTAGSLLTERGPDAASQRPVRGNVAESGSAVQLRSLGKTFRRSGRRTVAFEGVDLTVEPGEFVCLLGPSGCGKSTLLRVVAGILEPDEGTVTVGSRPVDGPGPDRGMLFQTPLLFPWLTTRDNVLFGPRAQRSRGLIDLSDDELRREADAMLETVGLSDFAQAFPHELSGGMRHRAAFARALITEPEVLLMDEPFGALDAITRLRMQQFLLRIWERHSLTVLFVTHDIEESILLGDRVAVMGGRPPGIAEIVDIPLRRPRDAGDVDSSEFLATKRHIRELLKI
jgi:NitT/TauT family transport system ATP-binding protein